MHTIRITCRNNSDARNFVTLGKLATCRHNGGKLIIATQVHCNDLEEVESLLDASHAVAGYEVTAS